MKGSIIRIIIVLALTVSALNVQAQSNNMKVMRLILTGQTEKLDSLIENKDFNIDAITPGGSFLHLAATGGNIEIVKMIHKEGCSIETPDKKNQTPIYRALLRGYPDIVEYFINQGGNLGHLDDRNQSPLSFLLSRGQKEVYSNASKLISAGADINTIDDRGYSPLCYSILKRRESVALMLIENGADLKWKERSSGNNLLSLCGVIGTDKIAKELMNHSCIADDEENLKLALKSSLKYGHPEMIKVLDFEDRLPTGLVDEFKVNPLKENTNDVVLWYLNTRGWLMELKDKTLIFDYEEAGNAPKQRSLRNGMIDSQSLGDNNIYTFYTCWHGYANEPAPVHRYDAQIPGITHVLNANDGFRGSDDYHYMLPGDKLSLEGIEISSFNSDPLTNGYCLSASGWDIIYTGFPDMEKIDEKIAKLRNTYDKVDVLFISSLNFDTDPNTSKHWAKRWIDAFNPDYIILKDNHGNEELMMEMKSELITQTRAKWFIPRYPGDRVHLSF